jgi:hypothetical protein
MKKIDFTKRILIKKNTIKNLKTNQDELNKELIKNFKFLFLDKEINKFQDKEINNEEILDSIILFFKDSELKYENKIIYNEITSTHEEFLVTYHIYKIIDENFSENTPITSSLKDYKFDRLKLLIGGKSDLLRNFLLQSCSDNIRFIDDLLTGRLCGWQILWNSITVKELILGKGFFGDQVFLKPIEKVSSNSFINIFYNAGIISLIICIIILIIFFTKFFKIRNLNDNNLYFALSHYLILYFLFRSIFEDTLAFVSIDFLIFSLCFSLICQKYKEKNN